jgi:hypothetical protein
MNSDIFSVYPKILFTKSLAADISLTFFLANDIGG